MFVSHKEFHFRLYLLRLGKYAYSENGFWGNNLNLSVSTFYFCLYWISFLQISSIKLKPNDYCICANITHCWYGICSLYKYLPRLGIERTTNDAEGSSASAPNGHQKVRSTISEKRHTKEFRWIGKLFGVGRKGNGRDLPAKGMIINKWIELAIQRSTGGGWAWICIDFVTSHGPTF